MIAKNIKGKSFKGCVNYVMNNTAELLEAEGVWADSARDMIRSFAMQRSGRKEIKQPVGHIPISFSPKDKHRMTNDFMVQLAKEYMQEMGIKNTQYVIVRHHNTDNDHLHIVYNRIDNDLKLISVNHDYKRNIKTCKRLKDKYNLTYGKGKEKVKREKLDNPDKIKYYIHDAIKAVLPTCKHPVDLRFALQKFEIEIDYKFKRTTREIEGVSFRYDNIAFKGSEIDQKFSFGNLKKEFEKNIEEAKIRGRAELLREQTEQKTKQEALKKTEIQPISVKRNLVVLGVELSDEQEKVLREGGIIFVENMIHPNDNTKFSAYAFANDDKDNISFSNKNPEESIKYGQYEMRLKDKILIEEGFVTKAKVKWYGGGFAHPYLWKENKTDVEYRENWGDPRVIEAKVEEKRKQIITPIIKKDKGMKM
ncbi:MAG: relaxase/mobilization nuclease domain-containing protein [Dysgonomonas mossii]|jgi:hypothetical protein|nr:relaxase/mobilization nuclease domain-containing protein [Dysgonomonas mossii]